MNVARLYKVGLVIFSVLGLALGVVACGGTGTEPFTTTGSVIVTVYPDDADVSLVALEAENAGLSVQGLEPQQTGASLHYLKLPGAYELTVSRDGYKPQTRAFTLQASELRYFSVFLEPEGDGPLPPEPDPIPDPEPPPDPGPAADLTLEGTVTDWTTDNGGHLTFTGGLIIYETEDGTEIFFSDPVYPTTIGEAGAFEVELTQPDSDFLLPSEFCATFANTAFVSFAGASTRPNPELGTVTGLIVQASTEDLQNPDVGDVAVAAIYFDRAIDVDCEEFGFSVDIDAQKGWNTVIQTVTGVDEDGFVEVALSTGPVPEDAQWLFVPVEDVLGEPQLLKTARLLGR